MKHFFGIFLSMLVWSGQILAQDNFPATYQVAGINLNIRTGPSTRFANFDNIPALSQITVLGLNDNGTWAEVEWDGRTGWVSSKYITRVASAVPEATINESLTFIATEGMLLDESEIVCVGTEPFWNVSIMDQTQLDYSTPDGEPVTAIIETIEPSANNPTSQLFSSIGFTGIVHPQQCSDGMSDTVYGWAIDLVVNNGFGAKLYSGCCSAVAN